MKDKIKKIVQSIINSAGRLYKRYIICSKWKSVVQKSSKSESIIVSVTSYRKRFEDVKIAIKSLGYQTQKANRVLLFVDDFENNDAMNVLDDLKEYGVEIVRVPYDLKPHKKYFFAMTQNPDTIVITIDDDCVYWPWTISSLMNTHRRYPKAVCARRVSKITYDQAGNIEPYNEWKQSYTKELKPSSQLFATGVGGVLYPPYSLSNMAFDVEAIKKYCYCADDVWLKIMETINNVDVVWTRCLLMHPIDIEDGTAEGLATLNVGANRNDVYMQETLKAYNLSPEIFRGV